MGILEEIRKRKVFCDGGMGSLLQARGLKPGELPETWNVLHPEILKEVHLEYLKAGCDIVTTNTFLSLIHILPISSAAICIMLSLDGLAGGAATAGCCAQMIGLSLIHI